MTSGHGSTGADGAISFSVGLVDSGTGGVASITGGLTTGTNSACIPSDLPFDLPSLLGHIHHIYELTCEDFCHLIHF